jgi:hypothetical protein
MAAALNIVLCACSSFPQSLMCLHGMLLRQMSNFKLLVGEWRKLYDKSCWRWYIGLPHCY